LSAEKIPLGFIDFSRGEPRECRGSLFSRGVSDIHLAFSRDAIISCYAFEESKLTIAAN
jgi:hypothetical protein